MSETTTIGWMSKARTVEVVTIEGGSYLSVGGALRTECHRCMGRGGFEVYAGLHNGVCYTCNGSGLARQSWADEAAVRKTIAAREAREARRAAKAAAKAAEAQAVADAWTAANPVLAARLAAVHAEVYLDSRDEMAVYAARTAGEAKYGEFIMLMANYASYKGLTEAQTEAVTKALDEAEAKAQAQAEAKAAQRHLDADKGAKVVVTGTVIVAINVDGYAYGTTDRMLVIEGTGEFTGVTFKITGKGATLWETAQGDAVEVTATVKDFREYNGTPQTVLTRAKVKTLASA